MGDGRTMGKIGNNTKRRGYAESERERESEQDSGRGRAMTTVRELARAEMEVVEVGKAPAPIGPSVNSVGLLGPGSG
jgi:hypothetical protein